MQRPQKSLAVFAACVAATIVACTSNEPIGPRAINGLTSAPNAAKGHEAQCDTILITAPTINITVGGTVQLTATAYTKNAKPIDKVTVTWSSFDVATAAVNSSGLVTGVSTGSAIIHAQCSATPGTGDIQINVQ